MLTNIKIIWYVLFCINFVHSESFHETDMY